LQQKLLEWGYRKLLTLQYLTPHGVLKNRYIGENIRLLFETIEYLINKNEPGLLIFADFEIAFDNIDHEFLFQCLEN
jgi:hypothetical protein